MRKTITRFLRMLRNVLLLFFLVGTVFIRFYPYAYHPVVPVSLDWKSPVFGESEKRNLIY